MPLNESPPESLNTPEALKAHILKVLGNLELELSKPANSLLPGSRMNNMKDIKLAPFIKALKKARKFPYLYAVTLILTRLLYLKRTSGLGRHAALSHVSQIKASLDHPGAFETRRLQPDAEARLIQFLDICVDAGVKLGVNALGLFMKSGDFDHITRRLNPFLSDPYFARYAGPLREYLLQMVPNSSANTPIIPSLYKRHINSFLHWLGSFQQSLITEAAQRFMLNEDSEAFSDVESPDFGTDVEHLHAQIRDQQARIRRMVAELKQAHQDNFRLSLSQPDSRLAREVVSIYRGPLSAGNLDPDAVMQLWAKHSADEERFKRALERLVSRTTHTDRKVEVTGSGAEQIRTNVETTLKAQFEGRSRVVEELVAQLKQDGAITDQWKYTNSS